MNRDRRRDEFEDDAGAAGSWDPYPSDYRDPNSPGYRSDRAPDRPRRREVEEEPSRFTAPLVAMAIAAIGSLVFLGVAIAARNIPLLATAALVVGVVFVALAVFGGRSTWRAAVDGRNGRAFALAVGGGLAALIGLGSLAVAITLVLISARP